MKNINFLFISALVIIAITIALSVVRGGSWLGKSMCDLEVINRSTETASTVHVKICDYFLTCHKMTSLTSLGLRYEITCESGYEVSVVFESGKTIVDNVGYVTRSIGSKDEVKNKIEIFSDKILFSSDFGLTP